RGAAAAKGIEDGGAGRNSPFSMEEAAHQLRMKARRIAVKAVGQRAIGRSQLAGSQAQRLGQQASGPWLTVGGDGPSAGGEGGSLAWLRDSFHERHFNKKRAIGPAGDCMAERKRKPAPKAKPAKKAAPKKKAPVKKAAPKKKAPVKKAKKLPVKK